MSAATPFFLKSAAQQRGFFSDGRPQIAVAGKSNVGKSSFINMLANQKKLARTSDTPGRTQLLNYFDFGAFVLTDLPGYGYAKVSRSEKEKWGELIESYLLNEPCLARVICLADIRHDPTEQDLQLAEFLYFHRIPFSLIATKADKLSKMQVGLHLKRIAVKYNVGPADVFAVSALKGTGRQQALTLLENAAAVWGESQIAESEQEVKSGLKPDENSLDIC